MKFIESIDLNKKTLKFVFNHVISVEYALILPMINLHQMLTDFSEVSLHIAFFFLFRRLQLIKILLKRFKSNSSTTNVMFIDFEIPERASYFTHSVRNNLAMKG